MGDRKLLETITSCVIVDATGVEDVNETREDELRLERELGAGAGTSNASTECDFSITKLP